MAWECGHTVEADLHGHVHFSGGWIYILRAKYMEKRILWQALFHGTPTVSGRRMNPIGGYFRGITLQGPDPEPDTSLLGGKT
jgi:hypothetical protein